jgi:restriction system protein
MGENLKHTLLLELAQNRQQATWPRQAGFENLGDYQGGRFECDYVSPYSRTAGNVDSDLLLFLQDWTSDEPKSERELQAMQQYGRTPWRVTNKKLDHLLAVHFNRDIRQVYATNLFPFIKPGRMSDGIFRQYLERAASEFAKPHISILQPKLVVVFGRDASQALAHACDRRDCKTWFGPASAPFCIEGATVWSQPHPAARIGAIEMDETWALMAQWYHTDTPSSYSLS